MRYRLAAPGRATLTAEQHHTINLIRLAQHFPGWTLEYIENLPYRWWAAANAVVQADATVRQAKTKRGDD